MPTADGTMNNRVLNYHLSKLDTIIMEYESRLIRPNTVLKDNNCETEVPNHPQFRAYEAYKHFYRSVSYLVIDIEYFLLPSFREVIKTVLSNYEGFENFPGQVYFIVTLDTCNISDAIDIKGKLKYFADLSLHDLPGENISDIATTALRNIKVSRGVYALLPKLGMTVPLKVCKTSNEFSIKIFLITMPIPMKWRSSIISNTLV